MWLELAGSGSAWLSHLLWYLTLEEPRRALRLPVAFSLHARRARILAAILAISSIGFWAAAHGVVLGGCVALAAWMAAASTNAIIAPLKLRALAVGAAIAAAALFIGTGGWLYGAL
jgi:hypothetical protein